jgi:hypothetical protein
LLLILVQLLQVDECVPVPRIEDDHLLEGFERTIDEAAVPEVESEAEQNVGMFELGQIRTLQQRLMHVDRPSHLSLLAVQVAEDHLDLERIGVC